MLKKIIGKVKNVSISDSMMDDGSKERNQGLITALASSALGQPSPGSIILAGYQGFKGKSIKFEIDNIKFKAMFTDVHFNENDIIVGIYDDQTGDTPTFLAALNPSNGILSLAFKLGSGTIANIKSTIKLKLILDVGTCILMFGLVYFLVDHNDSWYYLIYCIIFISCFIFTTITAICSIKEERKYNLITEDILRLLGFKNIKYIDLNIVQYKEKVNILESFDFRYREAVDYDPYPPESIPKLLKEIEDGTKKD